MSREQYKKVCKEWGIPIGSPKSIEYALWQAAQAAAVPEGWQVVPEEPTKEMIEASWDVAGIGVIGNQQVHIAIAYRVMLAAAPKPEDV